jgi:hypothetical protein
MNSVLLLSIAFSLLFVSGCGVGSLYGPSHYGESKLGENLLRVTFRGGRHPVTGELCLLRCAELCREAEFTHFEVVDSETGSSLRNTPSAYPFHRHYHLDEPFIEDIPFATKTIRLRNGEPEGGFAYEAREIEDLIKQKYEISR